MAGTVCAVEQMKETSRVIVVSSNEESGLLIGGGAQCAAASVTDAGGAVPVAGAVVVDFGAGEFDHRAGIVEEVEIADDAVDESIVEGVGAGDGVEEDVVLEGVVALKDLRAEFGLLGLEQASALGSLTDANRHPFPTASDGVGMGVLEKGQQGPGPAEQDAVSLGGAADSGRPGASRQRGELGEGTEGTGDGQRRVGCGIPEYGEELRKHTHPEVVKPGALGSRLLADEEVLVGELGEGVPLDRGRQAGIEELALVRQEGDQVGISWIGLLGGVAGDFTLSLHREAVDEHVVHAGPLASFGSQTPVEAGGLEGDDDLRETVGFGHSHGLGEKLVDLLGPAAEPAAPQDLPIMGEGGRLSLPGEVDTEHEGISWHTEPTSLSLLLLSAQPTGNQGPRRGDGGVGGGRGGNVYFGHGRLTSYVLGENLWDTKPAIPNLGQPSTLPPSELPHTKVCCRLRPPGGGLRPNRPEC